MLTIVNYTDPNAMASGYAKGFRSTVYKKTYLNGEKPPVKGSLSEKLKLTEIEAGDHIMVRHYESLNLKSKYSCN